MRKIKFRGLTISGEWVYGLLSISQGLKPQPDKGYYISNSAGQPWAFQVRPETVGQFTGLSDKNGKEVYESDICKMYGTSNQFDPYLYKIVFCEGAFCLEPIGFDMTGHQPASFIYTNDRLQEMDMGRNISKHIEVIGNLYENQNSLEK